MYLSKPPLEDKTTSIGVGVNENRSVMPIMHALLPPLEGVTVKTQK
jgi:hypothetical protein